MGPPPLAGVAEQKVRGQFLEVLGDGRMDGVGLVGGRKCGVASSGWVPVVNFKDKVNTVEDVEDGWGNTVSQRVARFSSCESGGALGHLAWIFPWSALLLNFL